MIFIKKHANDLLRHRQPRRNNSKMIVSLKLFLKMFSIRLNRNLVHSRVMGIFQARFRPINSATATLQPEMRVSRELKHEDFYDHKAIYQYKPTLQLMQAFVSLQLCSINFLVDHSLQVNIYHIF